MTEQTVTLTRDGAGVAVLELNNPPLNLLTAGLRQQLIGAVAELGKDHDVRAVVLRGSGRTFSAGSDVREFPVDIQEGRRRARLEHRAANALEELPQPVVAALHGHVLGGGLELALACDLRVAARDANLGLPEVGLGVFPSGGGTSRLAREVGPARAKELILLGTVIDAEDAQRLGLVNRLAEPGAAHAGGHELARQIAAQPALATRAVKEATAASVRTGSDSTEEHLIAELFTSHDAREGAEAFRRKRPPRFEHR